MAEKERTVLVDENGKRSDEVSDRTPPRQLKAVKDERLRDEDGKLLSDDPKAPPKLVKAGGFKKKMDKLYDNPRSQTDDD